MTIQIRKARDEQDVRSAMQLSLDDDMRWRLQRYGAASPLAQTEVEQIFQFWWGIYQSTPEGFMVAEDDERGLIVGVAAAVRRPPQWMLTNFYVHPDYQGRGIGHRLLTCAYAVQEGCDRFCLHASDDPAAQALYLRFGMYPQPHSIEFVGRAKQKLVVPHHLELEEVSYFEVLDAINALDCSALGYERVVDHRYWMRFGSYFLVRSGQNLLGYFRVGRLPGNESDVGPLVVAEDQSMGNVLQAALAIAQSRSEQQSLLVPGANKTAIALLFDYGYRCHDVELLMSSVPMPGLPRVVFQDTDLL
jgi:GNAT superfamily N-acetyltransferase